MEKYFILEDNLERLVKKVVRIQKKCEKYNLKFAFIPTGNVDYREVTTCDGNKITAKFIEIAVEGNVHHENWEFVGTIEHAEHGNVIRQFNTELAVPMRYRTASVVCEHCNKIRSRKDTYLIHNTETDEWKQVGSGCLQEFTNGLNAEAVARYISLYDEVIKGESPISGCGYRSFYSVEEIVRYAYETVLHFGYVKSEIDYDYRLRPTKIRTMEYYFADNRGGRASTTEEMEAVRFDANSEKVKEFAAAAINWASNVKIEGYSSYLENLKIICSSDYCESRDLGILVSLVPTYQRQLNMEVSAKNKEKELAVEAASSEYVGEVGAKVSLDTESIECVSSIDSMYGMTYLLKFSDADGNIYMWSTSNSYVTEIGGLKHITGTVKRHEEFRGVKQTWLTRCKVTAVAKLDN